MKLLSLSIQNFPLDVFYDEAILTLVFPHNLKSKKGVSFRADADGISLLSRGAAII